jgi:hypothetical protein
MPSNIQQSFEDIIAQDNTLHLELAAAVHALRADGTFSTAQLEKINFTEIIRKRTRMWTVVSIDRDIGINAYVVLPSMDKNHVFIEDCYKPWTTSKEATSVIHALGKPLLGAVNVQDCTVSGAYEKVLAPMVLGAQLLRSNKFSDLEVAAIILHELGHLWTYFQFLGVYVRTALVSGVVAKAAMDCDDVDERAQLISEGAKVLGLEHINSLNIAKLPKEHVNNAVQALFLTESVIRNRTESNNADYELRACEQLADQFAARHGAGCDLVTGLDRMWRVYNVSSTISPAMHVFIEVAKITGMLISIIGVPCLAIYIMIANPMQKTYDDPAQRIAFIKQQLITELKSERTTDLRRVSLLGDIAVIEGIEDGLTDRRTFIEWMITNLQPTARRSLKSEQVQKQIEALANNDLFVHAAKFQVGI